MCYPVDMEKLTTSHVSVRCPIDLIKKLDTEAANERRSRGFIIIEILENHFHKAATVSRNGVGRKKPVAKPVIKKKAGAR